jgi:hypothetical protein
MAIDGRAAPPHEGQQVDLTVIPALYEHALRVYQAMEAHSTIEEHQQGATWSSPLRVYDGHLTQLFKKLSLSVPYYTSIKNQLVGMGCIEQIRRGGGNATSKWVLWKCPELDAWKDFTPKKARRGNATQQMQGQIRDLHERVSKLEEMCEYMARMMPDGSRK